MIHLGIGFVGCARALPLGIDDHVGMRHDGVLPEDAPDPRVERHRRLGDMPSPVMGLIAQPSLEDTDSVSISDGQDGAGYTSFAVGITYTLWRNPADRSDPINLARLTDEMRTAIELVPPWPRPPWLVEQVQLLRFPQLWDAVWTTWDHDLSEHTTLTRHLVDHANDVLTNRYRDESVSRPRLSPEFRVTEGSVKPAAAVLVDGGATPAAEIDTNAIVYAIGAQTAPRTVVTAVLPRSELQYIRVAFATRRRLSDGRDGSFTPT